MAFFEELPLFSGLTAVEIGKLGDLTRPLNVDSGKVLFAQGDRPDKVYVVLRGAVKIVQTRGKAEEVLTRLGVGDMFGEIGVMQRQPRTASAVVDEDDSALLEMDGKRFVDLIAENPHIARVIHSTMFGRFKADMARAADRKEDAAGARFFPVFSASGGAGTTLLAANLATGVKGLTRKRVLLVDFDLMFGSQAEYFNVEGPPTLSDLVAEGNREESAILGCIQGTHAGVDVLKAPLYAEHAELVQPDFARSCLEAMRASYDYVFFDTTHVMTDLTLLLLEQAHLPIYVVTPEPSSLAAADRWFGLVRRVGLSSDRIRVLANKVPAGRSDGLTALRTRFGKAVLDELPLDADAARRAIDSSRLLGKAAPEAELSRAVLRAAGKLVGVDLPGVTGAKGFLSRWLGL